MKVTLDRHRLARVNGKPFFLIGARHMPEGGTPRLLADAGFNGYRWMAYGGEAMKPDLLPPPEPGIFFWSYIFNRADFTKNPGHPRQLRELAAKLRHHPSFLCYENWNEPTLLYHSSRPKSEPENLAVGTHLLRRLDPDHPVWLAHCCSNTMETLRRYNPCANIIGCNPYPVVPPGIRRHIGFRADGKFLDCPDQSIHAVGKYTGKMLAVGRARKPVWMLIQAMAHENWYNEVHTPQYAGQGVDRSMILYPTHQQIRFMVFDAIVSGATGLAFAMYKTPVRGSAWKNICRVVSELRSLHDALASPELPGTIRVSHRDLGFTIWEGVRVLARRLGNQIFVFAVNTSFDPAEATIHLPLKSPGTIQRVGERGRLTIRHGSFTDSFGPYGVRVYRIG